jgi:hypothetical protein
MKHVIDNQFRKRKKGTPRSHRNGLKIRAPSENLTMGLITFLDLIPVFHR